MHELSQEGERLCVCVRERGGRERERERERKQFLRKKRNRPNIYFQLFI